MKKIMTVFVLSLTVLSGLAQTKLDTLVTQQGQKIDGIAKNNKVSFCVIKTDDVIQKTFTTHFRSAIVFGRARILTEGSEKKYALECLVKKYSPDYMTEGQSEIEREWKLVSVAEVNIEHITGKTAIEIINNKV